MTQMNRKNLFTKENPFPTTEKRMGSDVPVVYEFTIYRIFISRFVDGVRYKGSLISDTVDLEVYGMSVKIKAPGEDGEVYWEFDFGPLSAHQYHVNYLIQLVCRKRIENVSHMHDIIREEVDTWNRNQWGNPFSQVAERALRAKKREEEQPNPSTLRFKTLHPVKKFGLLSRYNKVSDSLSNPNQGKGLDI